MSSGFPDEDHLSDLLIKFGADFSLVQGFGGNVSIKNPGRDRMVVKASGKRLGAVGASDYFHEVTLEGVTPIDNLPDQSSRPSIETSLHALVNDQFVIHLHSTLGVAISMMAQKDPDLDAELKNLGIDRVSYFRPGRELSQAIGVAIRDRKSVCVLLSNHGILLSADSVLELEEQTLAFEEWASTFLQTDKRNLISPHSNKPEVTELNAEKSRWHALTNWRVTPDHCVFLGPDPEKEALATLSLARNPERIFGFRGRSDSPTAAAEQLAFFYNLSQLLPKVVFNTLSRAEAQFLSTWEAERFRVSQAKPGHDE